MNSPDAVAEVRARRRRRLRQSLALQSAAAVSCDLTPDNASAAGDAASQPEGPSPVALADTVHELYESLLAARRLARQRLTLVQDIESRHGDTPLVELVDLAVRGALCSVGPTADVAL